MWYCIANNHTKGDHATKGTRIESVFDIRLDLGHDIQNPLRYLVAD